MAQAAGSWPVNAKAWLQSQAHPFGMCGGKNGIGTGSSPST